MTELSFHDEVLSCDDQECQHVTGVHITRCCSSRLRMGTQQCLHRVTPCCASLPALPAGKGRLLSKQVKTTMLFTFGLDANTVKASYKCFLCSVK